MSLLYISMAILLKDAGHDIVAYFLVGTAIFDIVITVASILLKLIK